MSEPKGRYATRVPLNVTVSQNTKRILEEQSKELELPISRIIDAWARERDNKENKERASE